MNVDVGAALAFWSLLVLPNRTHSIDGNANLMVLLSGTVVVVSKSPWTP